MKKKLKKCKKSVKRKMGGRLKMLSPCVGNI
jgi:hypothetical protein